MFKAKIESKKLLNPFNNFAQFIDESWVELKDDGLHAIASDRSIVCVCDFKIPITEFESYTLDRPTKIGLNITEFVAMLKRSGNSKFTTLELIDNESKLKIGFGIRTFTVSLLELGEQELPPTNELDKFTANAEFKSSVFTTAMKDTEVIEADSIVIEIKKGKLTFTADELQRLVEITLEKGTEALYNIEGNGKSCYALDFLKKLKPKSDKIKIEFGMDYPMRIIFDNFKFTIAPRVD